MKKITLLLCAMMCIALVGDIQAQNSSGLSDGSNFVSNAKGPAIVNGPAGSVTAQNSRSNRAPVVITHNVSQTINPGDGIACNAGGILNNNNFYREFDLDDDFGIAGDFNVQAAEFGIETLSGNYNFVINIFSAPAGTFPGGVGTLVGSTVYAGTNADEGTVVSAPVTGVIPAGENLIYEIVVVNDGVTSFFLGGNQDGQTGPSWILAPDCGANVITDLADFGLANAFVMNIVGEEALNCNSTNYAAAGLPADIDGAGTFTADCVNAPNLYPVDVTGVGTIGVNAEIENVSLDITHSFDGDLTISLVSPAGTELILSDQNGGAGADYIDTVFEDGGGDITGASAPFTGTFEPEGGTFAAAFDGEMVNGTWNLKVCDAFSGDSGTVDSFEINLCVPPPNDECTDAFVIACGDTMTGDTTGVSNSNGVGGPDQWFSFTGSGSAEVVTLSLCDGGTGYDSQLFVYDDCSFANLIASNDDSCGLQSELQFISDGSTTYYIAVDGFGAASEGAYSLSVSCMPPIPGDLCDDAIAMNCGDTVTGSTAMATVDTDATSCGQDITAPGVWYTFTDDFGFPSDYVVSLCDGGTDFDSKLTVYQGDDCGNLTCVVDNDDSCGLQSEVAFTGDGNSTYYILVHGFGGATGNYSMNLDCTPIPPPNDDIANAIDVDEIGVPYTDPAVAMPAATTEAGNPAGCNIDGANGVWYKMTADGDGNATATVVSPAGTTSVLWFTAPDENATEADLTLVDQFDNQCLPSDETFIRIGEGIVYYLFVVNTGGATDITIDGVNLGTNENLIEGFTFHPNPAESVLNLNALENIERATIFNMLGQQVVDQTIDATSAQLDIANLAIGAYVMKVSVNGQIGTYKIIKQ